MEKLSVGKNAYYQNQWKNKGFVITELGKGSFLIWKDDEVVKVTETLEEAEEWTNKESGNAEAQRLGRESNVDVQRAILILDMPKNCNECQLSTECLTKPNVSVCMATEKCNFFSKSDCTTKPDWCPLRKIPDKKKLNYKDYGKDMEAEGFNTCIDEILNGCGGSS